MRQHSLGNETIKQLVFGATRFQARLASHGLELGEGKARTEECKRVVGCQSGRRLPGGALPVRIAVRDLPPGWDAAGCAAGLPYSLATL